MDRSGEHAGILRAVIAFAFIALLEGGCAAPVVKPDFYPQKGSRNTLTYVDPKTRQEATVFDLRGRWAARYPSDPVNDEIVVITQQGNTFEGKKTKGDQFIGAGGVTISGTIDGNVVRCHSHTQRGDLPLYEGKLEANGDRFICPGHVPAAPPIPFSRVK